MQNRIYDVGGKENTRPSGTAAEFAVCALLSLGITGFLCAFTGSALYSVIMLAEAAVLCAVTALLRKKPAAPGIFCSALLLACAAFTAVNFTGMRVGMLSAANNFIYHMNEVFGTEVSLVGINARSSSGILMCGCIFTALLTEFICFLVRKRAVIAMTCTAFVFILSAIIFKIPASTFVMFVTLLGLIACWSCCTGGHTRNILYVCAGLAGVFLICLAITALSGAKSFDFVTRLHKDVRESVYETRFGSDSLPHGDLTKAPYMLEDSSEALTVTMDKPQKMYLKGFVGGALKENKWEEQKEGAMSGEWNGMLSWLKSENFSIAGEYAGYSGLDKDDNEYCEVSVENTGADRRYVYLPFTALTPKGAKENDDLQTVSGKLFGAKKYSFRSVAIDAEPELLNPSHWVNGSDDKEKSDYLRAENAYRAYVEDTYLDIDEDVEKEINEIFYTNFDSSGNDMGVYAITSRIRSVLKLTAAYEEFPEEPTDRDFVGWFLKKYKKGNSAYFATAAVMAYRAAGVPARYAEGYIVSDSDAQSMEEREVNTLRLSRRNSHAWVEIYRDGMGWISVDVTPGFYTESPEMMELIDISQIMDENALAGSGGQGEYYSGNSSRYSPQRAVREKEGMSTGMRLLAALLCVIIALLAALYMRYLILTALRISRTEYDSSNEAGIHIFGYAAKAAKHDGINISLDSPYDALDKFVQTYPSFTADEYRRVVSLIQQSRFSSSRLRENELRTIRLFYEKLSEEVYKNKSLVKKMLMKYIYCV